MLPAHLLPRPHVRLLLRSFFHGVQVPECLNGYTASDPRFWRGPLDEWFPNYLFQGVVKHRIKKKNPCPQNTKSVCAFGAWGPVIYFYEASHSCITGSYYFVPDPLSGVEYKLTQNLP